MRLRLYFQFTQNQYCTHLMDGNQFLLGEVEDLLVVEVRIHGGILVSQVVMVTEEQNLERQDEWVLVATWVPDSWNAGEH